MPRLAEISELGVSAAKMLRGRGPKTSCLLMGSIVLSTIIFLSGCSPFNPEPIPQQTVPETPTTQEPTGVALTSPQIVVLNIGKMVLDKEGLKLSLQAKILNANPRNVEIEDIKVSILTAAGLNNIQDTKTGGPIDSSSVRTFDFTIFLPKDLLTEKDLTLEINARAIMGETALPVSSTTAVNITDILNQVVMAPKITTQAKITKISKSVSGIQLEAEVEGSVSNPNPLSLYFNAIRLLIKDGKGATITSDMLTTTSIAANADYSFKKTIILPIQMLNETSLSAEVETSVIIPNYVKSFKGSTALKVPRLKDLISVPQIKVTLDLEDTQATQITNPVWVETVDPPFLKITAYTSIKNENELALTTGDLTVYLYNPKDTLIDSSTNALVQGIPGSSTKTLTNWFNISQDGVGLNKSEGRLTANIGIGLEGVNEKIPLSASLLLEIKPRGWPQ